MAWFTAGLTSTATVERLRGAITGPQDLPGKRVGTVADTTRCRTYALQVGHEAVCLIGPAFHRQSYGVPFPPDDPRRKRVNWVLLGLREDGRYDAIYSRWFGAESGETQSR